MLGKHSHFKLTSLGCFAHNEGLLAQHNEGLLAQHSVWDAVAEK